MHSKVPRRIKSKERKLYKYVPKDRILRERLCVDQTQERKKGMNHEKLIEKEGGHTKNDVLNLNFHC